MNAEIIIVVTVISLILLGVPIAIALATAGVVGLVVTGTGVVLLTATIGLWTTTNSFTLAAIPLFILMAGILSRSQAVGEGFKAIDSWAVLLPGRLLHTNVIGSALFAAVCASSSAACVTISKITLPRLTADGYNRSLVLGTLAGPTTLGILIPPSISFIIYGVIAGQSISRLFLAGFLPGLMLTVMFGLYVVIVAKRLGSVCKFEGTYTWRKRLQLTPKLLPLGILIVLILGSIYAGWATATEAGAWAVFAALIVALGFGGFSLSRLKDAAHEAMQSTVMVLFIVAGASLLAMAISRTELGEDVLALITSLQLSQYGLIGVLTVIYLVLGCFFDGISMMVLTLPLLLPVVTTSGIDMVWFGVMLTILIEMGTFTPPVGLNLFILHGITGEDIGKIALAALPMVGIMLLALLVLMFFPQIALWLPQTMMK